MTVRRTLSLVSVCPFLIAEYASDTAPVATPSTQTCAGGVSPCDTSHSTGNVRAAAPGAVFVQTLT